jgi:thiosulfate dehydrogenase
MNGKAPSNDSHVMKALNTYAYWLATKAPMGQNLPGRLYLVIPAPEKGADAGAECNTVIELKSGHHAAWRWPLASLGPSFRWGI